VLELQCLVAEVVAILGNRMRCTWACLSSRQLNWLAVKVLPAPMASWMSERESGSCRLRKEVSSPVDSYSYTNSRSRAARCCGRSAMYLAAWSATALSVTPARRLQQLVDVRAPAVPMQLPPWHNYPPSFVCMIWPMFLHHGHANYPLFTLSYNAVSNPYN